MVRQISCRVISSAPLTAASRGASAVKKSADMYQLGPQAADRGSSRIGDLLLYAVRSGVAMLCAEKAGIGGILDCRL